MSRKQIYKCSSQSWNYKTKENKYVYIVSNHILVLIIKF